MSTAADTVLADQAYRRGFAEWDVVQRIQARAMPPCYRCQEPAPGYLRPGEPVCPDCFRDVLAERDVAAGRLTRLDS